MFLSLWHRLWNGRPYPVRGRHLRGTRPRSCPLRVEPLEGRELPAASAAWVPVAAPPRVAVKCVSGFTPSPAALAGERLATMAGAASHEPPEAAAGPEPVIATPPGANRLTVTVGEDAAAAVIDLGSVFGGMKGIRLQDGLRLAMLGNTNPTLVKTDLSETALTLTFAPGKSGAATITVCATDADGVSAKETLLITVVPSGAGVRVESPAPARGMDGATAGPSR